MWDLKRSLSGPRCMLDSGSAPGGSELSVGRVWWVCIIIHPQLLFSVHTMSSGSLRKREKPWKPEKMLAKTS